MENDQHDNSNSELSEAQAQVSTPEAFNDHLLSNYLHSLGIDAHSCYVGGEAVAVVPPKQTTRHGILILGAYPTAVFERRDNHVIPVANIEEPFDPRTASGTELDQHYLGPLGIHRSECWITNLVKVFLFKSEHQRANASEACQLLRDDFEQIASSSANITWLQTELRMASPRLIITLGREVAGIVRGVRGNRQRNNLLSGSIEAHGFARTVYRWVHLPHPGIVMRPQSKRNGWPDKHKAFCAALKDQVRSMLASQP